MNKIEKINKFIKKNNIKGTIYSFNKKLINNSNEYPESYYAFDEQITSSYVYDICRDREKLIYQGNYEEAFALFLVKILFLDYCRNNKLDKDIYEQEKKAINVVDKELYYKNYKYYTFPNEIIDVEEVERLNRRVGYLKMFFEDVLSEGLIEDEVKLTQILKLLSK